MTRYHVRHKSGRYLSDPDTRTLTWNVDKAWVADYLAAHGWIQTSSDRYDYTLTTVHT